MIPKVTSGLSKSPPYFFFFRFRCGTASATSISRSFM